MKVYGFTWRFGAPIPLISIRSSSSENFCPDSWLTSCASDRQGNRNAIKMGYDSMVFCKKYVS